MQLAQSSVEMGRRVPAEREGSEILRGRGVIEQGHPGGHRDPSSFRPERIGSEICPQIPMSGGDPSFSTGTET